MKTINGNDLETKSGVVSELETILKSLEVGKAKMIQLHSEEQLSMDIDIQNIKNTIQRLKED